MICLWIGYLCDDVKIIRNLLKNSLSTLVLTYLKEPLESPKYSKRELVYIKDMESLKPNSFQGVDIWPLVCLKFILKHSVSMSNDLLECLQMCVTLFQSNKDMGVILDCFGIATLMSTECVSILNKNNDFIQTLMNTFNGNESLEKKAIKVLMNLSSEEEFPIKIVSFDTLESMLRRLIGYSVYNPYTIKAITTDHEDSQVNEDEGLSDILSIGLLLNFMELYPLIRSQIGSLACCVECTSIHSSIPCKDHDSTRTFCQYLSLELKCRLEKEEKDVFAYILKILNVFREHQDSLLRI